MSRRAINLKPEAEVAEVWKEYSSPPLNFALHVDDLLEKSCCIQQFSKIEDPSTTTWETTIPFSNKYLPVSPALLEKDQVPSWREEGPESKLVVGGF